MVAAIRGGCLPTTIEQTRKHPDPPSVLVASAAVTLRTTCTTFRRTLLPM
jgi:hypothetical protein